MILADSRIRSIEVLGKLKKGGLGRRSYESKLFGLGVDVFKGSQADRGRLVERALRLSGEDGIDVVSFDREIVGVFVIHLGLISSTGDVLFLGLTLLLIGCVRTGLVLLKLRMNLAWIPIEPATTLMTFWVSVLVLLVQTMEAFAIVSQEPRV